MRKRDDDLIVLDDATARWLEKLAAATGDSRADIVASILRDIRLDDERAHRNRRCH